MTNFEYIAGANTLILSFAVIRILSGVSHVWQPERQYWVHTVWVLQSIVFCVIAFWLFLSFRHVEWTLPKFIASLSSPALIYVLSSVVIPPDPSAIPSWRIYYYQVRIPFFAAGLSFMVVVTFTNHVLLGFPLFSVDSALGFAGVPIFAIGLASAKPRLHAALALVPFLVGMGVLLLYSDPGSLGGS